MAKKKGKSLTKTKEIKGQLGKKKETAREKMIGQSIGYRYDVNLLPDYSKITPFLKKYIEAMGWDDNPKSREEARSLGFKIEDITFKTNWQNTDLLVISPGIPYLYPKPHQVIANARKKSVIIDNDIGIFFSALKMEKIVMGLILSLITMVASLNIVGTLILVVLTRGREISILRAMGASSQQILQVFIIEGVIIGCVGTFLGTILGLLGCFFLKAVSQYKHLVYLHQQYQLNLC